MKEQMYPKPSSIAMTASLLLSLVIAGVFELIIWVLDVTAPWYTLILIFLFTFLFTGMAFRIMYQRYIFANLNHIYRNILRLRYPGNPDRPYKESGHDITTEINRILVDWSNESREEIDQLKQAEIYRREFLSNVSHELKTPIFSIQGYVHTLIDGGIDDPDVNVVYLNRASKSIDRLIGIVDDLESISKLEGGELVVEQRTFDLADLVREVIESLEFQAREKAVSLVYSGGSDRAFYAFGDKDLIRQVLVNLLVNSIKYGKVNGTTAVNVTEDENRLLVDVSDDGIGIEKQHLPRLFERFYRVDKSRSRDQGGTGLGLSIVKHIIEAHQQQIAVQSEPGVGTTFTFTLKKSK